MNKNDLKLILILLLLISLSLIIINKTKKESVSMAAGAENAVEDMNVMPGEMEVDANIKIVFSMVD